MLPPHEGTNRTPRQAWAKYRACRHPIEKVRWHLLGMGNEIDLHSPHFHGKTVLYKGHRTDVIELLPASMATVDMKADNQGTWMYHCHVSDHIDAGMLTTYSIVH